MVFASIFILIGLAATPFTFFRPLAKINAAKDWNTVPAEVFSSMVKSHSDDDGTTYSVYIAYRYEIDGREYAGDHYDFMGGSSSGYSSKQAVVRQYPPGRRFSVYVDPADPSESVIDREFTPATLVGLFPLLFTFFGAVFMVGLFRKRRINMKQAGERIVVLKGTSPVAKAAGILLFALVWNGVVFVLFRSDAPLLFPIVFGLFGLAMIGAAIHALLAIANPRPVVEITPGDIHPGTSVAVRWRTSGRIDRIDRFTIQLRCLEILTESHGSGKNRSTRTTKTPIHEELLLETGDHGAMAQGAVQFAVPPDALPTDDFSNPSIQWQLVLHGDIARWPDMQAELPFIVYPEA